MLPNIVIPIKNWIVNAYLIADTNHLTIIDTGLPGTTKRIKAALRRIGKDFSDLNMIIITHADGDHVGSLNELRQVSTATFYASLPEAVAIRKGENSRELQPRGIEILVYKAVGKLFDKKPGSIDQILQGGEVLPVLEGLQVINTPGHTPGHISLFLPERRILFSGDSIITGLTARPSKGSNTWDEEKARQAFELQMALNPKWICGGHGIQEILT